MKRILIGLAVLMVLAGFWAALPGRTPTSAQTADPAITRASELRLDRGYMIWREDTDSIYVLYDPPFGQCDGGVVEIYPDAWDESMPANDPSIVAPAGQSQPGRGFGYVWRNNPRVREGLGWTSFPESTNTMMVYTNGTKTWLSGVNGIFVLEGTTWHLSDLWTTDPCRNPTMPQPQQPTTQPTTQPTEAVPAATEESGD